MDPSVVLLCERISLRMTISRTAMPVLLISPEDISSESMTVLRGTPRRYPSMKKYHTPCGYPVPGLDDRFDREGRCMMQHAWRWDYCTVQ